MGPGFLAYQNLFADTSSSHLQSFALSSAVAPSRSVVLLIVPTAYWVTLAAAETATGRGVHHAAAIRDSGDRAGVRPHPALQPAAIAAHRTYASSRTRVCVYAALSFPYMYRSVDTGLRAMDVRLYRGCPKPGCGLATILFRVIFPNLRVALLSRRISDLRHCHR